MSFFSTDLTKEEFKCTNGIRMNQVGIAMKKNKRKKLASFPLAYQPNLTT